MKSIEDIYRLFKYRKDHVAPWRERALEVRSVYNHEASVPLPELDKREKVFVANLLAQGLDQEAARIASTTPNVVFPPTKVGSRRSQDQAQLRRKATLGWWAQNNMKIKMRRRARWLIGYASAPAWLSWDFARGIPRWEIRDPLNTYPAPTNDPDEFCPPDCIYVFTRTLAWLKQHYPTQVATVYRGRNANADDHFTILRYDDDAETVLVLLAQTQDPGDRPDWTTGTEPYAELERVPNRAGICLVVEPGRVNLDRPQGQFDGMVGMYQQQAMLQALEVLAVKRSIFPDEWAMGDQQVPQIITPANGLTGQIGVIKGGKLVSNQYVPGPQAPQAIDRLERNQRVTAGIPAEFGGECVDEETELFTEDGWKRYDEIGAGTIALTLNHDTGMSEWQSIEKMNVFPVESRRMVEMEGPRHSSLTTPNHRWPVVNRHHGRSWKFSGELNTNDQVPLAAMCADLPTEPKYSDALVECVAWFYTEGSMRPGGGQISQSATHNPENVERIRACLTGLFGPATYGWRHLSGSGQGGVGHDEVPRWNEEKPAANGVIKFNLSVHALRELVQIATGKVPRFDFLRSLTQAQLELFLTVSMRADNCGPDRFGQKDRARTEAFAFAAVLAGRGVSFQRRVKQESRPGWRPGSYESHLVRSRKRRFVKPKENATRGVSTFREVIHDGIVWCPTTPNGTWLARRRGTAYFTGNSGSNIRTGKRGDAVLSAAVDFPIQEAQEILAISLQEENRRAIAVAKAYGGNTPKTFWVPWKDVNTRIDYVPNQIFDTDENYVAWSHAGADVNSLIIGLGQRIGIGLMSKQTAREIDPLVDDSEEENDRIVGEAIEGAVLASFTSQAQQGAIPPVDAARVSDLVMSNKMSLPEAITKAHEEAQARQAQQAPPNSPQAQPGLGAPGQGAEQPAIPDQQGSPMGNLSMLLQNLRRPQRQTAGEPGGEAALQGQGAVNA